MSDTTVSFTANGQTRVAFFEGDSGGAEETHLQAVVIWRGPVVPREWVWSSMLRGQWPFGRRPSRRRVDEPLPEPWTAAADQGGPHEVLFSASRGIVQLRGQDYAVPTDGRTLVLLVQDPPDDSEDVGVEPYALAMPPRPALASERSWSRRKTTRRSLAHVEAMNEVWHSVLERDPVISDFLRRTGVPDGV
jgi:hypothetical protein